MYDCKSWVPHITSVFVGDLHLCGETKIKLLSVNRHFVYVFGSSGAASKNSNVTLYILQGGSCKICGGITHLARDCPNKVGKIYDSAAMVGQSCKWFLLASR